MKSFISLGVMALFASSAMARYCNDHDYYCGWNLLDIGNYDREIKDALREAGITDPTDKQVKQSLFYCRDNADNGVGFERTCDNKCNNGGQGQSDYCDSVGPTLAVWLAASVLSATLDEDTPSDFQEEEYLDIHYLVSLCNILKDCFFPLKREMGGAIWSDGVQKIELKEFSTIRMH